MKSFRPQKSCASCQKTQHAKEHHIPWMTGTCRALPQSQETHRLQLEPSFRKAVPSHSLHLPSVGLGAYSRADEAEETGLQLHKKA